MPIIPLEPQIFPSNLLESGGTDSADERRWWVLHTRPRQEKSLARDLYASRIPYFLPLSPRQTRIRNRIMTSYVPLFSSYLFLHANHEDRVSALSSSRVVRSIPVPDEQQLVRDLARGPSVASIRGKRHAEDRMVPGAIVAIQSGPLAGLRARSSRRPHVDVLSLRSISSNAAFRCFWTADSLVPIVAGPLQE